MKCVPSELTVSAPIARRVVEWEEVGCLLCSGRESTILLEAPDSIPGGSGLWFAVVQCQACGLCFTNPRPTRESIGQFYPAAYLPHQNRASSRRDRRLSSRKASGDLRDHVPWHGQGRLLDFGCGGGSYLERMHRQGWHVTGLDASPAAVEAVHAQLGLPALVGTLPHPDLQSGSFDVITMWHSLEHVHDPEAALKAAYRLLSPGGRLIVAVPNIDSLPFRWFGHAWFALDLPRHLTHFAPWTLDLMLQRAGFHVGRVKMIRHNKWLRASAELACQRPEHSRWHRVLTRKPAARLATWYSYLRRQSDCMIVTGWRPV